MIVRLLVLITGAAHTVTNGPRLGRKGWIDMRVLAFAASLRRDSLNKKLIRVAADIARERAAQVDLADFREFDMPLFDGDLNQEQGLPTGAAELKRRVEAADALIISVPEYNYSVPGTLKNAIDWVSRARPMPWRGKSVYLISASTSPMGGIRGLWQTRIPLEGCGALVFPDMFALAHAQEAFDGSGQLKNEQLAGRLRTEVDGFLRLVESYGGLWTAPEAGEQRRAIKAALEEQTELQPKA